MELGKPRVVAFLGRAGSGKSTATQYLIDKYGAQRCGFAVPLKELAKLLFQFTDEQVYGNQEVKEAVDPRYGMSPRVALQRLGNGARELIGQRVWVDACINYILETYKKDPTRSLFIIEDCRYRNEAEAITNDSRIRGSVIKLTCPNAKTSADPTHPSEAEVDLVPAHHIAVDIVSMISPGSKDLLERIQTAMEALQIKAE